MRSGLLWTGLAEIVFGAFWVVGGRMLPVVGTVWVPVGFFLMGLGVVFVIAAFIAGRRGEQAERLRALGVRGMALIHDVAGTGTYINGTPVVRLTMEVHVQGRPPYRLEGVKNFGMVPVGVWMPVRVDPANPESLVLVPEELAQSAPAPPATLQQWANQDRTPPT